LKEIAETGWGAGKKGEDVDIVAGELLKAGGWSWLLGATTQKRLQPSPCS